MIASATMEAAHKTIIQTQIKRIGQRWSPDGAPAMLYLRVIKESDR